MTEAPTDLYDEFVVPPMCTRDGELLSRLSDTPAGAWLAVVVESIDASSLKPADVPAYLQACARVQAWAAAMLTAGVAQLDDISPGPVDAEVAFALREPIGAAQTRIYRAKRLRSWLPNVWKRLAAGDLNERHVSALIEATAAVDDRAVMAEVEQRVLARPGAKTAVELVRHARDLLKRLDPAGAQRRARVARAAADVSLTPAGHGMGDVVMHAPIEDAVLIKTAVDAYAASRKSAGDARPLGVLRVEAPATWASAFLSGMTDGHVPRAAGRPIEVGVTIGLRSALGLDDLPGEVPGLGIVPRDAIAAMIDRELPALRAMVIDESSGRLLYRAEQSYRPTPAQVAQVRGTYVFSAGPVSSVLATRTDTDHVIEHPTGPTAIGNLVPLDRVWHNRKTRRSLTATLDDNGRVSMTTVLGQTRTVTPYDYRMTDDR